MTQKIRQFFNLFSTCRKKKKGTCCRGSKVMMKFRNQVLTISHGRNLVKTQWLSHLLCLYRTFTAHRLRLKILYQFKDIHPQYSTPKEDRCCVFIIFYKLTQIRKFVCNHFPHEIVTPHYCLFCLYHLSPTRSAVHTELFLLWLV